MAVDDRSLMVARQAVRAVICPSCHQRPPGSESWGARRRRTCESVCPIVQNLPRLIRIAECVQTSRPGAQDRAIRQLVCRTCRCGPDPGDFCPDRLACTCPLARSARDVLELLEKVVAHERRARVARIRARLLRAGDDR